jgi:drug/metabolite transporter (DMT)-like permease
MYYGYRVLKRDFISLVGALIILSTLPVMLYVGGTSSTGPAAFLTLTLAFSTAFSALAAQAKRRLGEAWRLLTDRRRGWLAVVGGVLNFAVAGLLLSVGSAGTSAPLAAVVYRSWVLMAAPLTPLILRSGVRRVEVAVSLTSFTALALTTLLGVDVSVGAYVPILFLSAFTTALSNVLIKRLDKANASAKSTDKVDVYAETLVFNASSLLAVTPWLSPQASASSFPQGSSWRRRTPGCSLTAWRVCSTSTRSNPSAPSTWAT